MADGVCVGEIVTVDVDVAVVVGSVAGTARALIAPTVLLPPPPQATRIALSASDQQRMARTIDVSPIGNARGPHSARRGR